MKPIDYLTNREIEQYKLVRKMIPVAKNKAQLGALKQELDQLLLFSVVRYRWEKGINKSGNGGTIVQ